MESCMYSKEDILLLRELQDDLIKQKNKMSDSKAFISLFENEKQNLSTTVALRIPSVNEKIFKVSGLTRAMDDEATCLKRCRDDYKWELVGIAAEAVCVSGVAVITACASLGSLTAPALIALIAEYAMMDYALASAERTYNQCKADC